MKDRKKAAGASSSSSSSSPKSSKMNPKLREMLDESTEVHLGRLTEGLRHTLAQRPVREHDDTEEMDSETPASGRDRSLSRGDANVKKVHRALRWVGNDVLANRIAQCLPRARC